jgi:hypothetical protein
MLSKIEDLKELVVWAKSQKIKSLKIGEISFEFSELSHLDALPDLSVSKDLAVPPSSPRLPGGNVQLSEEENDLFWSTR